MRFRSINCAHGSGASRYAVAPEHSKQLRKVVQTECGVDIYEDEGRYFPSVKFLRSHGIPVMMEIQEPGDVVVLKGGTQHWVRSLDMESTHPGILVSERSSSFKQHSNDMKLTRM